MLRGVLRSRSFAWMVVCAVVLTVLFKVALPLFVSTASIKTNMENALSHWTGGRASITGLPTISFWPTPLLTLQYVRIEGGTTQAPTLLAKAQAISAEFDILAALRGKPVFYDFHLLNPVVRIDRAADGRSNWQKAPWMTLRATGDGWRIPIGDITVEDGAVEISGFETQGIYRIGTISGKVTWPTPEEGIDARFSALINGRQTDWLFSCDAPMQFLSGSNTPFSIGMNAAAMTFDLEGNGNLSPGLFANARLQLTTPSLASFMQWSGLSDHMPSTDPGALGIDTELTVNGPMVKLDNLALTLQDSSAQGVLDIEWALEKTPRIGGTLAFDRIDLPFQLPAFPLNLSGSGQSALDRAWMKRLRLDLRLSAQQAVLGPMTLTDLAAGIMLDTDRASIDVGDSRYAGGSLSGRLQLTENGDTPSRFQVSLNNADLGAAVSNLGLQGSFPLGQGSVSLDVSSGKPIWQTTIPDLQGQFHLSSTNGELSNFNGGIFVQLAGTAESFTHAQIADGAFPFTTAEVEATLRDGSAELTKARVAGDSGTLTLSGVVPYRSGRLALSGSLAPADQTKAPVRFRVGGSWPDPIITALAATVSP